MKCAECERRECDKGKDCTPFRQEMIDACTQDKDVERMMQVADTVISDFYMQKTRVEETIEFIKRMGYAKVGLAFCKGLADEAATMNRALKNAGIKVSSACCKICGISKTEMNIPTKARQAPISCNPLGQAEILNRDKTDLNISFGLCVGHDILFNQASEAPVTTLVVKDRVLGHNPAAALYSGFYAARINGGKK
ncbi:DUF1847 domain-containing protein [Salidesulfovibrio onnuriiensis]|uniref:DUF1847 domain-containing protein n=1 Tax=Salidesulfovibrio onnuriiensis TaxID=2583823 RepID=UPI0011CA8B17|nr:DUF1847 domain-containing protein [Salidesulfovibrio onnuriiensis]